MFKGIGLLLLAELCFASATVFAKLVTQSSDIPGIELTFFRFLVGFTATAFIAHKLKISLIPHKINLVLWRAILNTIAVLLFFISVQYTSITNANMLNITYPVFIFVVAPLFTKDKARPVFYLFLALSSIGIYFIIHPDFHHINKGDVWGLLSGIVSAFAVIALRLAREHDAAILILFYLMGIGLIINFFLIATHFILPHGMNIMYVAFSAITGYLGQVCITIGYKYIHAREGSLLSASRIIFAVILGVSVFSEELSVRIIGGGLLILLSILGVGVINNGYLMSFGPFGHKSNKKITRKE